jgi:hypothetical protein
MMYMHPPLNIAWTVLNKVIDFYSKQWFDMAASACWRKCSLYGPLHKVVLNTITLTLEIQHDRHHIGHYGKMYKKLLYINCAQTLHE